MAVTDRDVEAIEQRIAQACAVHGRRRQDVRMIAVTKMATIVRTAQLIEAGCVHLAESRWQHASPKIQALRETAPHVTWHFIGTLQSNKLKHIVEAFTYIHALDRLSIAQQVDKLAHLHGKIMCAFVQVNVAQEPQKNGISLEELPLFLGQLLPLRALRIVGLMTMAPQGQSPQYITHIFEQLRDAQISINAQKITREPLTELSMGMSDDFELAIAAGATSVRIGSALVGDAARS